MNKMVENKWTARHIFVQVVLCLVGLVYIYSFFLPVINFYGGPIYGYELQLSPLILFGIIPNALVIITFLRFRKISLRSKIIILIVVIASSGFYILIGINEPYPLIDSLLLGYWYWFFSCIAVILVSLFESKSNQERIEQNNHP